MCSFRIIGISFEMVPYGPKWARIKTGKSSMAKDYFYTLPDPQNAGKSWPPVRNLIKILGGPIGNRCCYPFEPSSLLAAGLGWDGCWSLLLGSSELTMVGLGKVSLQRTGPAHKVSKTHSNEHWCNIANIHFRTYSTKEPGTVSILITKDLRTLRGQRI